MSSEYDDSELSPEWVKYYQLRSAWMYKYNAGVYAGPRPKRPSGTPKKPSFPFNNGLPGGFYTPKTFFKDPKAIKGKTVKVPQIPVVEKAHVLNTKDIQALDKLQDRLYKKLAQADKKKKLASIRMGKAKALFDRAAEDEKDAIGDFVEAASKLIKDQTNSLIPIPEALKVEPKQPMEKKESPNGIRFVDI